jgi:hypothetical protein
MLIVKCPKCGKDYVMGVNGVVNGCDECTGTVRNLPGGYVAMQGALDKLNATLDQNGKRIKKMQDQFYVMRPPANKVG